MPSVHTTYFLRFCLLLLLQIQNQAAAEPAKQQLTDDDLVVVELRVGHQVLTDNLFVYKTDTTLLLPLEELSGLLEFPIVVNSQQRTASGWFIKPENSFSLDTNDRTVTLAGEESPLPDANNIIAQYNELYVPSRLLEQWFQLTLTLNFADLRLNVKSLEPLPLEQRLAREKGRNSLNRKGNNAETIRYQADRYRWASYPTLDANVESTYTRQDNQTSAAASLSATGDLLKHSAFLNYNYNSRTESQNIRFNLSRYASTPEQRLPGGLFNYQLGDLYTTGDALISSGGDGVGISMSSSAFNQQSNYSTTVIEGDAPAGWEAELYRNNSLLAFQAVSSDGIYRFEDIELNYGNNNFEVRLYGPQGQSRIDRSSNYIGTNQLPAGRFNYAFYALDEEHNRLFGDQATMSSRRSNQDIRAELNYGMTRDWSAGLAWNRLSRDEDGIMVDHDYLSVNNMLSLNGMFLQSTLSQDSKGGNAALFSVRTRLAEQNIDFEHRHFNNFSSEKNPLDNQLEYDTEFRLSGNLKLDRYINYSLAAEQEAFLNAPERYRLKTRLSTQLAGINLTHSQTASKVAGEDSFTLPGSLSASYHSTEGGVSSTLSYNLKADDEPISSVSGSLRNNLDSRRHNLLQLSYEPGNDDSWSIKNSFTWKLDEANLTLRAETNDDNDWQVTAGINFSAGYNPYSDTPWISSRPSSRSGTLNTRVFWDKDNSGTFSEGDQPLSGISLLGPGVNKEITSDASGRLQLRNLPTFRGVGLSVNEDTLEDPYWQLRNTPDALYLHNGAQADLDLPIVAVSEIEGQLFSADNNGQYPLKSTRLLLVNDLGEVVATTVTEFDGLFLFDAVNPGNYQIVADSEYLNKKGLPTPPAQPITATVDGGVLNTGSTVLYSRGHATSPARNKPAAKPSAITNIEPAESWDSVKPRYIRPELLKKFPAEYYAVQLLAAATAAEIQTFARSYNLPHTHFVRIRHDDQNRFMLLLNMYANQQQAQWALDALPATLHQRQPTIVPLGEIQRQLGQPASLVDNYPPHYPQHYQLLASSFAERIQATSRWLSTRAANGYTLQLLASYDPDDLEDYIKKHKLQNQALVSVTQRNQRPWYLLLYGYHPDHKGAIQLRSELPEAMSAFQPWIRSLTTLQPERLARE